MYAETEKTFIALAIAPLVSQIFQSFSTGMICFKVTITSQTNRSMREDVWESMRILSWMDYGTTNESFTGHLLI